MITLDNIRIREIEIYHPETYRDNEYYIKYYESQGVPREETRKLVEEKLAKDKRYVISEGSGENSLTMGIKAAEKVLKKAGLVGQDMDMVCFVSCTPEYNIPPTSLKIHAAIKGSSEALCYDFNAACIGLVSAMEQLCRYMSASQRVNKILLIGSECFTHMFDSKMEDYYAAFGDLACAMILEKTEEKSSLIDSAYYVDSSVHEYAAGPGCGLSNIFTASPEQMLYKSGAPAWDFNRIVQNVKDILQENHLTPQEIALYCVCQFSEGIVKGFRSQLGVSDERIPYVGRKYGYTGSSTPFLVLYEAIRQEKIQRGDYICFWTTGYSIETISAIIRY